MTEREKFEKWFIEDGHLQSTTISEKMLMLQAWQAAAKAAALQWIPVSERLPDVGELILVYDETDFYGHIYTIKTCERTILRMRGDVPHYTKVTHWMPLPAAPEVK